MVQRTSVVLVDDLDGSTENVQTVSFVWEGRGYEIDLSAENYDAAAKAIAPLIAAGRRAGGARRSSTSSRASRTSSAASTIREWAAANGVEVSARGRIPAEIREQFDAAQK